jgi:hypothetical protein
MSATWGGYGGNFGSLNLLCVTPNTDDKVKKSDLTEMKKSDMIEMNKPMSVSTGPKKCTKNHNRFSALARDGDESDEGDKDDNSKDSQSDRKLEHHKP